MILNITSRHLELTPAIDNYIKNKIEPLAKLIKDWDKMGAVKVEFEVARTTNHHHKGDDIYYAEARVEIEGDMVRVDEKASDLYAAIDKVKDVLSQALVKYKEKRKSNLG